MQIIHRGLDVSSHQGIIDWKRVKNTGYEFCFIRVGFRGYGSTGSLNLDKYFVNNVKNAFENGFDIGLYMFSTSITEDESIEEAEFIYNALLTNDLLDYINLPIVYDHEGYKNKSYRNYGTTTEKRTAMCLAFQNYIKNKGFSCLLYGSQGNIRVTYNLNTLTDLVWCAKYAGGYTSIVESETSFPNIGEFTDRVAIWQYTSIGKVDGITGNVDLDNMYIDIINEKTTIDSDKVVGYECPYEEPTEDFKYELLKVSKVQVRVKWLQFMLNLNGASLVVDGKFGKLTDKALKKFQIKLGITCNCGICCKLTRYKLKGVIL